MLQYTEQKTLLFSALYTRSSPRNRRYYSYYGRRNVESSAYNGLVLGVDAAVTLACCAFILVAMAARAYRQTTKRISCSVEHEPKYSPQFVWRMCPTTD